MTFVQLDEAETETFMEACEAGRLEEVETTLKKPQDPDATNMARGETPLMLAAHNGHLEVATLLEARRWGGQAAWTDGPTARAAWFVAMNRSLPLLTRESFSAKRREVTR